MTQLSRREALAMQEPAKEQDLQGKIENARFMYELCKRDAEEYPDKRDHFLKEAETYRLELERLIVQQATEVWGPDWEETADNLHAVLENGEAQIELEETLEWLGVEVKTPDLQVVQSTFHVSQEWTKRHLNVETNGFEAELNTAFGKGNWTLK